jgi:acyl-CoA thioesterase-1
MSLRVAYGAARRIVYALLLMVGVESGASAQEKDVHVLAFGDSLTAGYGLPRDQGFAPQLQDVLRRNGVRAFVTNAGVSGNTTSNGRARVRWTLDGLKRKPDLAIVALGANDMLRGMRPEQTREDLDFILAEFKKRDIPVIVAGMLAPPNLGRDYMAKYNAIFPDLARKYDAPLYPFFLAGVAGVPALNLPDRVHPNFQGVKRMVTGIAPTVLKAIGESRLAG